MTAVVCTPLLVEQVALGRLPGGVRVVRTGMGPRRGDGGWRPGRTPDRPAGPTIVAGVAGGLSAGVCPGDVVVASEVHGDGPAVGVPSAPLLAGALRRLGLRVHVGPVVSVPRPVDGAARHDLAATGALAVDMESAYLAPAGGPFAVVRTIVDSPDHPLWHPGTVPRGIRALRALRWAAPAVAQWAAAAHEREVLLGDSAQGADLVLVLGSPRPPGRPDAHLARDPGAHPVRDTGAHLVRDTGAHLVRDPGEIDLRWLAGARRVGIVAGAATPPHLVDDLVRTLTGLGPLTLHKNRFTMPREVT